MLLKTLPAGIFWERTSGSSHTVTIRREPEVIYEHYLQHLYAAQGQYAPSNAAAQQLRAISVNPYLAGHLGLLGGIFGALG